MLLSARGINKRFGTAGDIEAVRDVDLDVAAGEFVSIVGRSGSGKSTLLALLGALTPPSEGEVRIDGTNVWSLTERQRASFRGRQVGFVFQFPSLLATLTVADNVAAPALLAGSMDAGAAYARAHELLRRVGIGDRVGAYPTGLSGGEQRRVAIARALINGPRLLLADEPTSDLDEDTETDIIDLLESLQACEGFGFVLVTHDRALAARAGRTYEMRRSELITVDAVPLLQRAVAAADRRGGVPAAHPADGATAAAAVAAAPVPLGSSLWQGIQTYTTTIIAIAGLVVLVDFAVGAYQERQVHEQRTRTAAIESLALNAVRGDVEAIEDLGKGRYQVTLYLTETGRGGPVYASTPEVHAYVQVGTAWQEVPIASDSADGGSPASGVRQIDGRETWRFVFEPRVPGFTQLLPHYMHVRFTSTMLISPSRMPKTDLFERKDNYYVYLKPDDVADAVVQARLRFPGRPPVWIPMPPH